MDLGVDFNSSDIGGLSRDERITKCREMAREAERLASMGTDEKRAEYFDLARRWSALADDMECAPEHRPEA